jgi:thiol-disulfide isomerase/thioredoxin
MRRALFLCVALTLAAQSKLAPVDDAAYAKLIAAQKGKVVLVDFWATWCKPCRKEMPEIAKLQQKLAARGFTVITISTDEPEQEASARKVLEDDHITGAAYIKKTADDDKFYVKVDPEWTSGAVPAVFLYDRNGKRVKSFIGETPTSQIEAAINKIL